MSELIKQAASMLQRGKIIIFPTETVYALACSAYDNAAIARIYEIKGRDFNKPLALLVKDIASLEGVVKLNDDALKLARAFCPGPITFVLPKADGCTLTNGTNQQLYTMAVRIPDHTIALQILQEVSCPIFATSANPSGMKEATDADGVKEYFPELDMVIDGGKCQIGKASTIVDLCGENPVILREGSITKGQIEAVLSEL